MNLAIGVKESMTSPAAPLTLEEFARLESLQVEMTEALSLPGPLTQRGFVGRRNFTDAMTESESKLLASARRLIELESALAYLEECTTSGEEFYFHHYTIDHLIKCAIELGWKSPLRAPHAHP